MTAQRAGHDATPSRVVATLAFGFWVTLLGRGGRIERAGPKADYEEEGGGQLPHLRRIRRVA